MMNANVYKPIWDKISIGASLACTVHCILLPLLFGTLPLLGIELLENTALEIVTIAISALLGGWAIYRGYYHFHRSKLVILLFLAGIAALTAGNLAEREATEMAFKLTGAIALVAAHLRNRRKCKRCC
ncbi:MerC domain-containing protein [Filimonas effusa]|uniref:MerC domain-containing protein n=1 Tax=Filimonas effusa TaxID=2508721 RepID=A0A4Q1D9K1_9BACT|nr:MerC domain-containing protein [Filimonas effusa]RXK86021.1 MerC domain-containing protein [Filimonas effusa]